MKDIKIIVATHKEYEMPECDCYVPMYVGANRGGNPGYVADNTGDNISELNSCFCELTGLYWAWKNMNCEYLGLAHYRRHFKTNNSYFHFKKCNKDLIATKSDIIEALEKNSVIVPKKRRYYIESLYSHYSNTHYEKDLIETKKIIEKKYPEYVSSFDLVLNRTYGHMFNMFIMKKDLADQYCEWLFNILFELQDVVDICDYSVFQSRLFGRISEILFNVWLEQNNIRPYEMKYTYLGRVNWSKKTKCFLKAKFKKEKYECSF